MAIGRGQVNKSYRSSFGLMFPILFRMPGWKRIPSAEALDWDVPDAVLGCPVGSDFLLRMPVIGMFPIL